MCHHSLAQAEVTSATRGLAGWRLRRRGRATGLGPVLAGALFDKYGGYDVAVMVMAPTVLLSSVLIFGLPKKPKTDDGPELTAGPSTMASGAKPDAA